MQCVDPVMFEFHKRFVGGGINCKVVYGVVREVEMFMYERSFALVYA